MPTLIVVQSELTRSIEPTIAPSTSDYGTVHVQEGSGQVGLASGAGEAGAAGQQAAEQMRQHTQQRDDDGHC